MCVSATHASGDIPLELVEDLLYGLHVGLQVLDVLCHSGQGCRQNRVQIKRQYAVHGVAGKLRLKGEESTGMVTVFVLTLHWCVRLVCVFFFPLNAFESQQLLAIMNSLRGELRVKLTLKDSSTLWSRSAVSKSSFASCKQRKLVLSALWGLR